MEPWNFFFFVLFVVVHEDQGIWAGNGIFRIVIAILGPTFNPPYPLCNHLMASTFTVQRSLFVSSCKCANTAHVRAIVGVVFINFSAFTIEQRGNVHRGSLYTVFSQPNSKSSRLSSQETALRLMLLAPYGFGHHVLNRVGLVEQLCGVTAVSSHTVVPPEFLSTAFQAMGGQNKMRKVHRGRRSFEKISLEVIVVQRHDQRGQNVCHGVGVYVECQWGVGALCSWCVFFFGGGGG